MLGHQGRWDSQLLKRNLGGRQRSFPRSLIEFCLCCKCSFPLSLRPSATSTLSPRTSQNGFIWGRGICQSTQPNLQVGTGRAAIALRYLLYLVFTMYPLSPKISQILDFKQQKRTLARFNEKGIWKNWRGTGGTGENGQKPRQFQYFSQQEDAPWNLTGSISRGHHHSTARNEPAALWLSASHPAELESK